MTITPDVARLVKTIAAAADSKKAENIVALDVTGLVAWTDALVLASAATERTVIAIAEAVEDALREAGSRPLRVEGKSEGRWILIDCGDAVVHVMHEEEREYYGLERLWNQAPVLSVVPA